MEGLRHRERERERERGWRIISMNGIDRLRCGAGAKPTFVSSWTMGEGIPDLDYLLLAFYKH
jgi:hypothetical protein